MPEMLIYTGDLKARIEPSKDLNDLLALKIVPPSQGVGSFLSNEETVSALSFSSDSDIPSIATATFGDNRAQATLDDFGGAGRTFLFELYLIDQTGTAATAIDVDNIYQPISFEILGTAGETGHVTLELLNELTHVSGAASAFCIVNNEVRGAYTGGIPELVFPAPFPRSEVIRLPFSIGDRFSFSSFLFGTPILNGIVEAKFKSTLRLIADATVTISKPSLIGRRALGNLLGVGLSGQDVGETKG